MTVRNNLGIYSECATGIGAEAVESHSSFSYIVCLNHSTEAARIRNMGWKSGGGGGGLHRFSQESRKWNESCSADFRVGMGYMYAAVCSNLCKTQVELTDAQARVDARPASSPVPG